MMNNFARSHKVMVSSVGMNTVCLKSQSMIMRIVSKLDAKGSFSMKSINIEFYKCLEIRSFLKNL